MQKVTQKNVSVRKEEVGTGREIPGDMLARVVSRCASEVVINTGAGEERAPDQEKERESESGSTEPPP